LISIIGGTLPRAQKGGRRSRIMFKTNVGNLDRILRVVLGVVLIALVLVGPHTAWGWIGIVPLVTGLFRTCPAYSLIGINTCRARGLKP
jgi:hypothetical protein